VSYACVAFTPDGQRVLAGGNDWQPNGRNEVIVWDVASKMQVRKLTGHRQAILCLACSPNGRVVAAGGVDNTIHLWDVDNGKSLKTLRGHQDWVESVTFMEDGKTVVSGSHDGTVRFWDVTQGRERARINIRQGPWRPHEGTAGPSGRVRAVRITPNGATLLVGSGPRGFKLFDSFTRKQTDELWKIASESPAEDPAPSQPGRLTMDDLPVVPPPTSGGSAFARPAFLLALALGCLLILSCGFLLYQRRRRQGGTESSARLAPSMSFRCPACGKLLKARPQLAGKRSKCPRCDTPVAIPRGEAPAQDNKESGSVPSE
jgi:phage FluMu protein Com